MVEDFSPQPTSNQVLEVRKMQFLFRSGDNYTLMDQENYKQFEISPSQLGNQVAFLKEGLEGIRVTLWEGTMIGINPPEMVELELVQLVEQEQIGSKILMGILETGAKIELPKKIEPGSTVIVDTRFGKFAGVRKRSMHN